MKKRVLLHKGDVVMAVGILLLSLIPLLLFSNRTGERALITRYGETVGELNLHENGTYTVPGDYPLVLTVSEGKIAVTAAHCPDKQCIGEGWISRGGAVIVCAPAGVVVRIVGDQEVDGIAW